MLSNVFEFKVDAPGYYKTIQEFSVKNFSTEELPSLTKLKIYLLNSTIPTTTTPKTTPSLTSTTTKQDSIKTTVVDEEESTLLEMNHFLRHFHYTTDPNSEFNKGLKPDIFTCLSSMLIIDMFLFVIL